MCLFRRVLLGIEYCVDPAKSIESSNDGFDLLLTGNSVNLWLFLLV